MSALLVFVVLVCGYAPVAGFARIGRNVHKGFDMTVSDGSSTALEMEESNKCACMQAAVFACLSM
jgi:hypothetical protein